MLIYMRHFRSRHTHNCVKGYGKIYHETGNQNEAGVTILMLDKVGFKIKTVTRDKEGHYVMTKGINPRRKYSTCKYICMQHRNTSI